MKHIHLRKAKICFFLLIFCAANASYAIHPHVLDSAKAHHPDFSEIFIAHEPDQKEQKILKDQVIKEAKSLFRSDRYAKKQEQRSAKSYRPGNGKQIGWFLFWSLLALGMVVLALIFWWAAVIVSIDGGTGIGFLIIGAIFSVFSFLLILIKLFRWTKKFPGNKSVIN